MIIEKNKVHKLKLSFWWKLNKAYRPNNSSCKTTFLYPVKELRKIIESTRIIISLIGSRCFFVIISFGGRRLGAGGGACGRRRGLCYLRTNEMILSGEWNRWLIFSEKNCRSCCCLGGVVLLQRLLDIKFLQFQNNELVFFSDFYYWCSCCFLKINTCITFRKNKKARSDKALRAALLPCPPPPLWLDLKIIVVYSNYLNWMMEVV